MSNLYSSLYNTDSDSDTDNNMKNKINTKLTKSKFLRKKYSNLPSSIQEAHKPLVHKPFIHKPLVQLCINGLYDEYSNLPSSIQEAQKLKRNLTLKQIIIIMNLNGLMGEMYNVIHDRLQTQFRHYRTKIIYESRTVNVSLYNWYDLIKIEKMIDIMLCP